MTANEEYDQDINDVQAAMQMCEDDFEDRILSLEDHEKRKSPYDEDCYSEENLQQ